MSSVEENVDLVRRFFQAFQDRDWNAIKQFYLNGAVEEFPQSRERIVGGDNIVEVMRNYPDLPKVSGLRVYGSGDLVISEMLVRYGDGGEYFGVIILDIRDGRIAKQTEFFGPPFDAPEWRNRWVERTEALRLEDPESGLAGDETSPG